MPLLIFRSNENDPKDADHKAQQVSVSCLIPASKIEYWQSADCLYYGRNFADIDLNDMLSVIASDLFKDNVILIKVDDGLKISDKSIQSFGDQLLGYCHKQITESELINFCHFLMREARWEDTRAKLFVVDHYHADLTDGGVS